MSFSNLRTAIATKLGTVSKIAKVYRNSPEPEYIEQFPAAVVVPSGNISGYETNVDNERVYGFTVSLVVNLKGRTLANAELAMEDLVDDVINAFDNDEFLDDIDGSGTPVTLAAKYSMIGVIPLPTAWVVNDKLEQLIAQVEIRCKLSYSTS